MRTARILTVLTAMSTAPYAIAQQSSQPQLSVSPTNRTLTVTANDTVTVDPDVAIVHIGFETQPASAKDAYASGAQTSNAIIDALKQAGIAESAIHSESQFLNRDYSVPKSHKFVLTEQWTVKTTPKRAAEILDVAVTAGANSSGQIEWTVNDERALENQALDKAAARAKADAAELAKGMGVRLGALIYVSNEVSAPVQPVMMRYSAGVAAPPPPPPLAIEPQKVTRSASIYAVYAIE
ncbi:MAG TPA: SIMPL domain-containing protein [Terracidiphilus sp.]|nr:SIMPL domain-containing protein [Terracidiphilus sp.]